jgi:hypothetical protein
VLLTIQIWDVPACNWVSVPDVSINGGAFILKQLSALTASTLN